MWKKQGKLAVKSPQAQRPSQFLRLHNILSTFHTCIHHSSTEVSPQIEAGLKGWLTEDLSHDPTTSAPVIFFFG